MVYAFVVALVAAIVLAYALYTQNKASAKQAEEQQRLLDDYQQRVNEQQKLLEDYRALEKNFDNVGEGYEQALLAFDKMNEEQDKARAANEALQNTVQQLQEANNQLQQDAQKKAEAMKQVVSDLMATGDQKLAALAGKISDLDEIQPNQAPFERTDNIMVAQVAEEAVRQTVIIPSETKSPVILVTSCINGEGKSYVSCNIALSLAILGKKVVLVGLDIRKPMISVYFNLSTKGHLTDYLAEPGISVDDIIIPSGEHKNLDLIPCGIIPPNPAELLQTKRLDDLFAVLRKRYDYIIVDTAPVAMVSDTYLLDRLSDMTIFVSRFKYTPTDMIEYLNQIVDQERMHNVACVLNAVKNTHAGYGGYGYGGYGYGYGKRD